MITNVHILKPPPQRIMDDFLSHLDPGIVVTTGAEIDIPASYHVLVGGCPKRTHLTASPSLQTLIIPFAGLPQETRELLLEFPDIEVHNIHHNAQATAEMAVALLLAAAKYIVPIDRELRNFNWTRYYKDGPSKLIHGKTAVILGYGNIGRRVGAICQALGMTVIGVGRKCVEEKKEDAGVRVSVIDDLNELLPNADVLMITVPLTPETEGLIGKTELDLMPCGSVLVNVARGPIVDQSALYHALEEGHLSSAGLDVWYNYPDRDGERSDVPPADFPFHKLENVVMSPHRGGSVVESETLRMQHLTRLLNAAAGEQPIPNRVDVHSGY